MDPYELSPVGRAVRRILAQADWIDNDQAVPSMMSNTINELVVQPLLEQLEVTTRAMHRMEDKLLQLYVSEDEVKELRRGR